MRLGILRRILEICSCGDRGGRSQLKQELLFKIIPRLKTWLKHAHLHGSIDVKFIFNGTRLGLFSSSNILQIADVANGVIFLLFLPCFLLFFSPSYYS